MVCAAICVTFVCVIQYTQTHFVLLRDYVMRVTTVHV